MATKIIKEEEIELQDGRKVVVRPLNIKGLRKFMAIVGKFEEVESEEDSLDLMVEAVQIALTKADPEIADDIDYLEENLDMNSINRIMEVAGGIDMSGGDPNLPKAG
jgi:hypothetical protein